MYMSNAEKGGETVFPLLEGKLQQPKDDSWSDCAKGVYAEIESTKLSLHGSCPVIQGEKWSATKWIRVRSFETSNEEDASSGECVDKNVFCSSWARDGECKKNPEYMVGDNIRKGDCRKSCNVC
ncbi:unnamed protein product [Amaranthus hypochondriacus]